jgi:hypothetical protein
MFGDTKEPATAVDDPPTMNELETVTQDEPETLSAEGQRILTWRYDQFVSLGLTDAEAQLLAEVGADLGLLRRLIGLGCEPALAFQIAF